jgi:hypothetical protein
MPHIRELFVQGTGYRTAGRLNSTIHTFLVVQKKAIRAAFSEASGYSLVEIALIPDMVPEEVKRLADNLLPLEFVIDAGTTCIGRCEEVAEAFKASVLKLNHADRFHFGVWLRAGGENHYTEHKPG